MPCFILNLFDIVLKLAADLFRHQGFQNASGLYGRKKRQGCFMLVDTDVGSGRVSKNVQDHACIQT